MENPECPNCHTNAQVLEAGSIAGEDMYECMHCERRFPANVWAEDRTFGDYLEIKKKSYNMVVVCVNLIQSTPVYLRLPHQVYKKDLVELKRKYPDARSFRILPIYSGDSIHVSLSEIE